MNRPRRIIFWIMVIALVGVSSAMSADEQVVRIASVNWIPYTGQQLPDEGFLSRIVRSAFDRAGYRVEFHYRPWKRAVALTKKGKWEGLMGAYYSEDRAKALAYADSIWTVREHLFTTHNPPMKYRTLTDLKPYVIGVIRGAQHEKILQDAGLTLDFASHLEYNVKKLIAKRIDLVIESPEALFARARKYLTVAELQQLQRIDPPFAVQEVYLVISKKSPRHQQLRTDFNLGLQAIRADGTYASILVKHEIQQPSE